MNTSPQERQAENSAGLRERLFKTLDAVVAGDIGKEEVEAVCYVSEQIIKSAKMDLEFESMAQERLRLQHKIEQEKGQAIALLGNIMDDSEEVDYE